ncbi:MAG: DNA internalization-related competence protein ComEC/Rec2 [Candidatus Sumerlaeota bacterium]|nr:DNA internalization-related competence protein ComEC/Rec2 [Candidatus Sumerlaeota bacterium]
MDQGQTSSYSTMGDEAFTQRRPQMPRPAAILALCLIGGMFLGLALPLTAFGALALAMLAIVSHFIARARWPGRFGGGQLLWVAVVLVGVAQQRVIFFEDDYSARMLDAQTLNTRVIVHGRIASDPELREPGAGLRESGANSREASLIFDLDNCEIQSPAAEKPIGEKSDSKKTDSQQTDFKKTASDNVVPIPMGIRVVCRGPAAQKAISARLGRGDGVVALYAVRGAKGKSNPGVFDYNAFLKQNGVIASVICREPDLISFPESERSQRLDHRLLSAIRDYRQAILALMRREMPERSANLAAATFLGGTALLTDDQRTAFLRAGMMDLFSVSGLNIGIIGLFIYLMLRLMRLPPRGAFIVSCVMILIYDGLTGFPASIMRATIMYVCLFAPFFLRYKVQVLSSLATAAVFILLTSPRALWQPGFQLSFLCLAGITILLPTLWETFMPAQDDDAPPSAREKEKRPSRRELWLQSAKSVARRYVLLPLLTCIAAQLSVLPLIAEYYHTVSLVGPLSSILSAVPIFGAMSFSTLLATVGFLGEPAAALCAFATQASVTALESIAQNTASLPGAWFKLTPMPYYFVAAYYLWLFSAPYLMTRRTPVETARACSALLIRLAGVVAFLALLPLARMSQSDLHVVFLDVGQGDSCLIEFPDKATMLVDGGPSGTGQGRVWNPHAAIAAPAAGTADQGRRTLIPALDTRGVERLDWVAVSHPDADHIGGLTAVEAEFLPRQTFLSCSTQTAAQAPDFYEAARLYSLRTETLREGALLRRPKYRIETLWPDSLALAGTEVNPMSLVLRVVYRRFALLLTGDVDAASEARLVSKNAPLECAVLKVSHHGSANGTSPPFLQAAAPLAAVISCGENNRYGHPAPEVMDRLRQAGTLIYRTDRDGAIEFKTDGERLYVRTSGK